MGPSFGSIRKTNFGYSIYSSCLGNISRHADDSGFDAASCGSRSVVFEMNNLKSRLAIKRDKYIVGLFSFRGSLHKWVIGGLIASALGIR